MLKVIKLLILCLLAFPTVSLSQKATYIGGEAALTHDVYEIIDHGDGLKNVPIISGLFGFNIRQHITEQFFLVRAQ